MSNIQRRHNGPVLRRAKEIMTDLGWTQNVSVYDILKSVETHFKEYRITVVYVQQYNQINRTNEGPDYVYAEREGPEVRLTKQCQDKTIYLIYDPEAQHYGGCISPLAAFKRTGGHKKWCHRCVSAFSVYGRCNCAPDLNLRKECIRQPKKCFYCGLFKCKGEGCFRNCRFCGVTFKKGYNPENDEGHRCIIYQEESKETICETEENPSKDYKLWVYDLESRITRSETTSTMQFEVDEENKFVFENGKIKTSTVQANEHKVNLVVFRNVFDENSEQMFFGDDCLERFITYLLITNDGKNIAVAHNGSGYDTRLIFEALIRMDQRYKPTVINRGTKLMQMRVDNLVFKDSFLFLPSSLANLAKSFDLPLRKGIFPHLFNTVENYDYDGSLPPKEFFDLKFYAKTMKDIEDFNLWYEERAATPWNFKNELTEYCRDDVKILALLVKKFHEICVEKFSISPWFSSTAPAYVHSVVIKQISKNLEIPPEGEERRIAVQEALKTSWAALKPEEYWFARKALRGGRTDVRKLRHVLTDHEKQRGIKIKYVDVVSMYPAVQVKYPYPVGVPKIHVFDEDFYPCNVHCNPKSGNDSELQCECTLEEKQFKRDKFLDIEMHWEQPSENFIRNTFGFICVTCEPPKHLYHPVLVTYDTENSKCIASLGTLVKEVFTTEEFKVALDLGYQIIKVHRIDHYASSEGLWNDFIKDLYIEKLATSGDAPTDEEKINDICNQYENSFGMGDAVKASMQRWRYDGALRTVFKTLLNCGWGKHCQRPNMDQDVIIHEEQDLENLFDNVQQGVHKVQRISDLHDGYRAVRVRNTDGRKLNTHNNYIPAGCYVPAYGRLTLFKYLNLVGERVLYHDTDSIIYLYDPEKENIPENDLWGDWEEEKISKKGIDAFVSLGPKSYAIKAGDETIVKLKGVSLKHSHREIINFDVMSKCIDDHLENVYPQIQVPQYNFNYKPGRGIETRQFIKLVQFKPENLKGTLKSDENLLVYPNHYCRSCAGGFICPDTYS